MNQKEQRLFNCKDEELPIICRFADFSFTRDLEAFILYSPKYGGSFASEFKALIVEVDELVSPESETIEMKKITEQLFSNINALSDPINRLQGYIEMAYNTMKVSPSDFGLSDLRKGINAKDPEKVIGQLKKVNNNITTYQAELTPQGLNDELITKFTTGLSAIEANKQRQYEILSNRKAIVQSNVSTLNRLYEQFQGILKTGKILYKNSDQVKLQEYTFTDLLKRVHRKNSKPDEDSKPDKETDAGTD